MLDKLFPGNRFIKAEDLRKTWRIIIMVVFGQLFGFFIGLVFTLHPDKFLSIWSGAAFGTFPGFILGVIWYYQSEDRRKGIPYFTLGFFALGSILLPIVAFGLISSGLAFTNLQEDMKSLNPSTIDKLVVYKGYKKRNVLEITDKTALESFAYACRDVEGDYFQNAKPCRTIDRYYIELTGILPKDIILDHCETDLATGSFATREGNRTTYHGTFSSKSLKPWLTSYVIGNIEK